MSAPTLLCLDTALAAATVGIARGDQVLAEQQITTKREHAERLGGIVQELLAQSHLTLGELDAIAVGLGPGSFVGVRIGVATAKGLAFGAGLPLIGLPSSASLALSAAAAGRVAVAVDAKKGQVYAALYRIEGGALVESLLDPCALDPDQALARFQELGPLEARIGDGFERFAEFFAPLDATPLAAPLLSTAGMARLALVELVAGRFADADSLVPLYARRSEAEVKRDQA